MRSSIILIVLFLGLTAANAQSLKVMSYNIHVGQDAANKDQLKSMADFIKSTNADVVGLQEVDSVCNRTGKIDQIKYLAEHTGMYYAYARHFAFDGGSYGIGILSKFPLSDIKDHRIILTSDGKSDAATRALLTAKVYVGKTPLTFATVHMDYRDSDSRFAQSGELVNLLGSMVGPVILTGDFNAGPESREVVKLESILKHAGSDSDFTFPVLKPTKKIDYVMVSKAHLAKVKKAEVLPVLFSDHLPLIAVVKLKPSR